MVKTLGEENHFVELLTRDRNGVFMMCVITAMKKSKGLVLFLEGAVARVAESAGRRGAEGERHT
jgi:hypothetical protein